MKTFIPAVIWALVILLLSITPDSNLPQSVKDLLSVDKVGHVGVYLVLTGLFLLGFYLRRPLNRRLGWSVVFLCSLYGLVIEIMQYAFFPYRHFELFDIIANIIGSVLGLYIFKFFLK